MKISASLYSNKTKNRIDLVKELDKYHIDAFHIDCNDDLSVFDDIEQIKKVSNTPVDLHIISNEPEKYFDLIREHNVDWVAFQYENLERPLVVPPDIKARLGLSVVSDTDVDVFEEYKGTFDFILIMTTQPGVSGGKFNTQNFKKIRKFRKMFPGKAIHVDGGVNHEISFILRDLGVHSVVSGSYLVNDDDLAGALLNLKAKSVDSHYYVKDFMIDLEDMPVLNLGTCSVRDVLQKIDDYNFGFTTFCDSKGCLVGVASNADIRRALLRNLDDFNGIVVSDLVNPNPYKIAQDATVSEMIRFVGSVSIPLQFLPVVDADNKLTGGITFFNLIRGDA